MTKKAELEQQGFKSIGAVSSTKTCWYKMINEKIRHAI